MMRQTRMQVFFAEKYQIGRFFFSDVLDKGPKECGFDMNSGYQALISQRTVKVLH